MHISATVANLYNGLRRIKIILLLRDHVPSFEELGDHLKALHREGIFVDGIYKQMRRKKLMFLLMVFYQFYAPPPQKD